MAYNRHSKHKIFVPTQATDRAGHHLSVKAWVYWQTHKEL